VAGGRFDESVHRGRHFRSQDGLAPVVILPAHDHPAKVALDRVIVDGNSWILGESCEPFPKGSACTYALAQTDSLVVHVATAPTHGVLPELGQSHVFGLLLEWQVPSFVRCLGVLAATECFAQCRTASRSDRAPADTADTRGSASRYFLRTCAMQCASCTFGLPLASV
jgi:hypothetical protein